MKNSIILGITVFITFLSYAQTGINYKAILKDDLGNVLDNTFMNIQFSIHQTSATGTIIYQEDHNYTTDANGLVVLIIGTDPLPTVGLFSTIDWNTDLHFLQTTITYSGNTLDFDATQFMAVPYAKHAETAANAATKIDDLTDGKTPAGGTALYIGNDAGLNDLGNNNGVFTRNVGIGFEALKTNTTGRNNTAVGNLALNANTTGRDNTAVGYLALNTTTTGSSNTAIGDKTLSLNTTGLSNTAIGSIALSNNTIGVRNTAIGQQALGLNTSGIENTAVGENALEKNTEGNNNTAIGQEALERNTEGSNNTSIGREALENNLTGNRNIALGNNAGRRNSTGSDNIFIGFNSGGDINTFGDSNKLYINNENSNEPLIYGEFDNNLIRIHGTFEVNDGVNNRFKILENGNVGIGRVTPSSLLEVAHPNSAPTTSNYTNAFSIHNLGTGSSWQFHTVANNHLSLYRNGSYRGFFNEGSGTYSSISDRRVKKNITPLDNGTLNKVMQLNPVSYLMKEQTDTKRNLGLISQEVQEIFPSITHYVEEQDLITLSYTELIPILIKALQEQQGIIEEQNAKIYGQNLKLDSFENDLSIVLKRLENLEAINN